MTVDCKACGACCVGEYDDGLGFADVLVDDMKRMKMLGGTIVGLIAIGGTAFGASLIWWGEQVAGLFRYLLKLP